MRLIDADKLMGHLMDWALHDNATEIRECMEAVEEQPTVDPVKHGWWRYFGDETIEDGGYCSVCLREQPMFWVKKTWRYVETRYCPHCGAYMVGEEE